MSMKLLRIMRTDSLVRYRHEVTGETTKANSSKKQGETEDYTGTEERDVIAHDAPLKKFDDCLQALRKVAAKVLECPPDWAETVVVKSLSISHTKNGTRSASIGFTKSIHSTSSLHGMATPFFRIDDDKEEGRRQCAPTHADMVVDMIREAEKYANGKRQQMQLPLGEAEKVKSGMSKEDLTEPIKFPEGSAAAGE